MSTRHYEKWSIGLAVASFSINVLSAQGYLPDSGLYWDMREMTLEAYMQRVVTFNESIQGRILGFQAARRLRMAELGDFEPSFVASGEYVDRRQPNNFQIERSLGLLLSGEEGGYPSVFKERNHIYTSALEVFSPLGTKLRLGATGRRLRNNVPRPEEFLDIDEEYELTLGISVEQPLLKGMGLAANLASLRLAARQSEIAFQDYRREFMQVVAEAELAYWDLYYAQEELDLSQESVELAETLLNDSKASFDAGRGAQLDVLEAEAGLALRQSRQRESYQKRIEAMNRMAAFYGGVPRESGENLKVVEAPESQVVDMSFEAGIRAAMAMNPDLLKTRLQKEQELIRMGYSKNQKLPEVNLTASFGSAGLGFDWESAYEDVERARFPDWKLGIVVRLPIWGDNRGRNEYRAAHLRFRQAERIESDLMTQLRVGRDTSQHRVTSSYTTARSLEAVVAFRTNLLDTRMKSRDIGRMDARSVLEAEQELFVAKLEQLQSEVEFQRALLELQLITGSLLQLRGLEVSFRELEESTRNWIRNNEQTEAVLVYQPPKFNSLPAYDPIDFEGDSVPIPWFGINWGDWDGPPIWTTVINDVLDPTRYAHPANGHNPRRFSTGSIQ